MPPIEPPKRPDLYVVARFLDRLEAAPDGIPRARLQQAVRLNYDLYRSYLALLEKREWVEGTDVVAITGKGREAHARLVGWIRDAFGDIRL